MVQGPAEACAQRQEPAVWQFVGVARGQVSWCFMVFSPPIQAASLGMADSLILMVLALVVFGPRRLPQIGKQIGKLMYEFRKASNDFKFQMEEELRNAEEADRRKREEAERLRTLAETQKALAQAQNGAEPAVTAGAQARTEVDAAQSAAVPEPIYPEDPYYDDLLGEPFPNTAAETSPAAPAAEQPAAVQQAESGLRVRPPSTGQQIAAGRPGRAAAAEASQTEPADGEHASEQPPPASEPAARHG